MRLTPGLTIGQHHGGGKGDQILFRGFDSDHGTDFAVFIDGIPANMVSHAHGQGYADLHWLIPETIARASYPPIALRMGLESDVTLRIEVDTKGQVTKAEITKSGGTGFDEEALRAVKQSRFEPAQKDGKNIPAEFTYIYRFRLQR